MKTEKHEKIILIDADVIIHLIKAGQLSLLKELYPSRVYALDMVMEELKSINATQLTMILGLEIFQQMPFPTSNPEMFREYVRLKKAGKGKGESACMAVCRYQKDIIASNNLKDIGAYCQEFQIQYLTTMDILAIGYKKNKLTQADADYAIYLIKSRGGKLPNYNEIEQYILKAFDHDKLKY